MFRPSRVAVLFPLLASALLAPSMAAQQPEPSVDDELLELQITRACAALHADGSLVACSKLVEQARTARSFAVPAVAPAPAAGPLAPADLCSRLRQSVRIVGHYFLCKECDDWHFSGASGFVVGASGLVATCHHVLAADETMRDAFLVCADLQGRVWPVERVLAADAGSDLCVLLTAERDAVPLPLAPRVRQGERIYCLSHPDHQFAFFSEGLVARLYAQRDPVPEGTKAPPADQVPARRWLHVTCDFAKGSSGAPIVDALGAVVGIAQSTTTVVYDEDAELVDTQMVFKTATPAGMLRALLPIVPAAPAAAGDGK